MRLHGYPDAVASQSVLVTEACRAYDSRGHMQWDRQVYDLDFNLTESTLLDAVREHTYELGPKVGVPRSVALANGGVVTRWSHRDGLADHRVARFQPRDVERGVRIGGCSIHRADQCIQEDVFPDEYDTFSQWNTRHTHVELGAIQMLLQHAECDWNRTSPWQRESYMDAVLDAREPVPGRRCCDRTGALSREEAGKILLAAQVIMEYLPRQGGALGALDILLGWRAHGLWTDWCDWPGWNPLEPLEPEVRAQWATLLALESLA